MEGFLSKAPLERRRTGAPLERCLSEGFQQSRSRFIYRRSKNEMIFLMSFNKSIHNLFLPLGEPEKLKVPQELRKNSASFTRPSCSFLTHRLPHLAPAAHFNEEGFQFWRHAATNKTPSQPNRRLTPTKVWEGEFDGIFRPIKSGLHHTNSHATHTPHTPHTRAEKRTHKK